METGEIQAELRNIFNKLTSIDEHLRVQNSRIGKSENRLTAIETTCSFAAKTRAEVADRISCHQDWISRQSGGARSTRAIFLYVFQVCTLAVAIVALVRK